MLILSQRQGRVNFKLNETRFLLLCRINLILIRSSHLQTIFKFLFLVFELWTKISILYGLSNLYLGTLKLNIALSWTCLSPPFSAPPFPATPITTWDRSIARNSFMGEWIGINYSLPRKSNCKLLLWLCPWESPGWDKSSSAQGLTLFSSIFKW